MASEDTPVVAARRSRLRAWIKEHFDGSRKAFLEDVASRGGYLDPTEVSNLQSGKKSFGEVKAEQVEIAANMPKGYLVSPLSSEDDPWADVIGYSHAAGLGSGPEAAEWAETHKLKFRRESLSRKRLNPNNLAVMYGAGDSMEPVIRSGDAILFDRSDTTPKNRHIYVLLVPGAGAEEYVVKRALVSKGETFFVSDNLEGDHTWKEPRKLEEGMKIVGRVRWTGGWV
ncbi:TPA: S24 family peptidase [Stenotrophomonas maltophilia]